MMIVRWAASGLWHSKLVSIRAAYVVKKCQEKRLAFVSPKSHLHLCDFGRRFIHIRVRCDESKCTSLCIYVSVRMLCMLIVFSWRRNTANILVGESFSISTFLSYERWTFASILSIRHLPMPTNPSNRTTSCPFPYRIRPTLSVVHAGIHQTAPVPVEPGEELEEEVEVPVLAGEHARVELCLLPCQSIGLGCN